MNCGKVVYILRIVENLNYHSGFIHFTIVIIAVLRQLMGEIGYTGGFNIGDEYLGKDKHFGYWRDYHVRIKGEGAKDLEEQFALDWKRDTKEEIKRSTNKASKGNTLHTMTSYNGHYVAKKYIELIKQAQHSIVIATPYFIAKNKESMNALIAAQKAWCYSKNTLVI